ncbi:MAG: PilZ domain-containing protein [Candidatus Sulfotelmatobacter sp.]
MAFQCLLVSPDPSVFGTMDRILQDFSIRTSVCPNSSSAANLLAEGTTDLIVIDLESEHCSELMHEICESRMRQKPTIMAVSTVDTAIPGVHVVLRKPVTPESGVKSLKVAYSRMLQDYRKHTRFALMTAVLATDENKRTISVTVTNIGEGGVGLSSKEKLRIGSSLSFPVTLPGLGSEILIRARVLWNRQYGAAGCEFARISPGDLLVLHAWLESRYRFKKPLIPV